MQSDHRMLDQLPEILGKDDTEIIYVHTTTLEGKDNPIPLDDFSEASLMECLDESTVPNSPPRAILRRYYAKARA
jgi:hypothetical protein